MSEITLHFPGLVYPGSRVDAPPRGLAPRLASLAGKRVLLFDNGKLDSRYGHYGEIFSLLAQHLPAQYGVRDCLRRRHDLLPMAAAALRQLAQELADTGAEAVVLALSDSGVTAYTTILAWELEQHGLPTVTLCNGQCLYLAAAMSLPVMPGVPLVQLAIQRFSSAADIAAEVRRQIGEVVEALTIAPEALRTRFLHTFARSPEPWQTDANEELVVWPTQRLPLDDTQPQTLTLDPAAYAAACYETLCDRGMCDGLPVIPPSRQHVDAMMTYCDLSPAAVLVPQCFPSGLPLTVQTLAVNAVMAGCRPEYFPLLLTAAQAVAEPPYRLLQGLITSHPSGNAIIISGPLAQEVGLASGGGCLGPGFRANVTIGRALNLSLVNVGRGLPGQADLSTMGSPAELTFCCAESGQASPWPPRHVDLFDADTTALTVLKCEGPHNVLDHLSTSAEGILRGIVSVAATLGGNNAYVPAELLVLLNPEHAHFIAADGWSKQDVQRYIFEHARLPRHLLAGRGIAPVRPAAFETLTEVPVVNSPDDVLVIVAGTHGPHSMVGIPWGYSRAVTKAVRLRDGRPARRIEDFRAAP